MVLIFHDSKYHLTSRMHDRFDRETRLSFCIRLSYYVVYICTSINITTFVEYEVKFVHKSYNALKIYLTRIK